MTRAGSYGQSFAQKHLAEGRTGEALAEADRAVARDPDDPEARLDRAQVHLALERYPEAVEDLVRCIELDRVERIVDDGLVDDTLFSSLVRWGQAVASADPEQAVAIVARYRTIWPGGTHLGEVDEWTRRFRGERPTWVKERD